MHLARNYVLIAHADFVIKLPKSPVTDADGNQRVKGYKRLRFFALPFPVFSGLESDSVEAAGSDDNRNRVLSALKIFPEFARLVLTHI